jgi:hypothetical protein
MGQRRVHVERRVGAGHELFDHDREGGRTALAAVALFDTERPPARVEQRLPCFLESGRDADLASLEATALVVAGPVVRSQVLLHPAVGLLEHRRYLFFAPVGKRSLAEQLVELELLEQQKRQIAEVGLVLIGVRHRLPRGYE